VRESEGREGSDVVGLDWAMGKPKHVDKGGRVGRVGCRITDGPQ